MLHVNSDQKLMAVWRGGKDDLARLYVAEGEGWTLVTRSPRLKDWLVPEDPGAQGRTLS